MPSRARRICQYCQHCHTGRCEQAPLPPDRTAIQKLYWTKAWADRRAYQLSHYPLCNDCLEQGKTTVASEAHHIIKHNGDERIFNTSPLMSLCKSCHSIRTAKGE